MLLIHHSKARVILLRYLNELKSFLQMHCRSLNLYYDPNRLSFKHLCKFFQVREITEFDLN